MSNCDKGSISAVTNRNCIGRLSRYKSSLIHLKELGFKKVFSNYLAQAVGTSSAQIRKDFSIFKIQGNKRGGYEIDSLITRLNSILNKNETQKVILVGAGNLGSALMHYRGFVKEGFHLLAAFDIDPVKLNSQIDIPVLSLLVLPKFIKENEVEFGIISVPAVVAQRVFDIMIEAGIRGVLNFAPYCLNSTDPRVFVNNVNLEVELEQLVYFVKLGKKPPVFPDECNDESDKSIYQSKCSIVKGS